jgi:acyl carrier protein
VGLDFVEIKMQIEDRFEITLEEDDWLSSEGLVIETAGDFYETILRKLIVWKSARQDIRLNFEVWEEVRDKVSVVTHRPPESIRLGDSLKELFPRSNRRELWQQLREVSDYRLPELEYPKWVPRLGLFLALGMGVLDQFHIWQIPGAQWLWPILCVIGIWIMVETYTKFLSICARFRTRFPDKLRTVKDLCRNVIDKNYRDMDVQYFPPASEFCHDVWDQMAEIFQEVLGVDREEIKPESRLIADLGME